MKKLIGGIMMAVGIVIAGATGLCTVSFLVPGLAGGDLSILPLALLFGCLPLAIGLGLFFWGRALVNDQEEQP